MESNFGEIFRDSFSKIKEIAGAETVIGESITTPNGTTIIPICKVSLGFASGGVDFNGNGESKQQKQSSGGTVNTNGNGNTNGSFTNPAQKNGNTKTKNFGGGGGTGLTITPIAFLVVAPDGDVNILNVAASEQQGPVSMIDAISSIIEKSPEIIKKLRDAFASGKKDAEDEYEN